MADITLYLWLWNVRGPLQFYLFNFQAEMVGWIQALSQVPILLDTNKVTFFRSLFCLVKSYFTEGITRILPNIWFISYISAINIFYLWEITSNCPELDNGLAAHYDHGRTSADLEMKWMFFATLGCLLDPLPWPEGSNELRSVCPSNLLFFV